MRAAARRVGTGAIRPSRRTALIGGALGAAVLIEAANLLLVRDEATRATLSNVLQLTAAVLAAGSFGAATRRLRQRGSDAALGWTLICVGAVLLVLAQVASAALEAVSGSVQYPSLDDAFSLMAYAVLAIAVWKLPRERLNGDDQLAALLDFAVLLTITVVAWWELSVGHLWRTAVTAPSPAVVAALAAAILNLTLLVALFRQLVFNLSRGRMFVPNTLLVIGGLCMAGADMTLAGADLVAGFKSGSPIDLGWLVCAALATLAGQYVLDRGDEADVSRGAAARAVLPAIVSYGCLLGGVGILVWDLARPGGANMPLLVAAAVTVLGLSGWRQSVTLRGNAQLTRSLEQATATLETEVQLRTADLEATTASLRESEERFRSAFEDAPLGVAVVDSTTGRIIDVNARCTQILGRSRDDLLRLDWSALTPPEDISAQRAILARLADGEVSDVELEKRYLRPDGSTVWTHITIAPLRGVDPAQPRRQVMIEDITERRAAAEHLARATELLERTGALARVGGWQLDLRTGGVFWSTEVYRMAEAPPDYLPTLATALDFYAPEGRDAIQAAVNRAMADGTPFDLDLPAISATGKRLWVHTQGSVTIEDGKPVQVYGAIQDITAQKLAQDALREKSEELDRYFTSSLDLLCIANMEGTFLRLNPEWERVLGYQTDELVGRNFVDLVHPQDVPATVETVSRLEDQQHVFNFQNRYLAKDGTYRWIEWRSAPAGRHIYAAARDVTDRHLAEEANARLEMQVRQAQKMESVGRLAGGVAHDFNNMLGAILGNAELALEALALDDPVRGELLEIQVAAQQSAALTRQLLAFARKSDTKPTLLNLNDTVHEMLPMVQRLIGAAVQLTWQPGANLWPVAVDPAQLDQALVNLCLNARDAIADVGVITIGTENRVVDDAFCASHADAVPGDFVVLRVSDTGAGMAPEVLEHLFEPFFTTKGVGAGTGLGLATVYGYVQQNGGFVTVTSELGRGSTLEIYLPRQLGRVTAVPHEAPAIGAQPKRATVLVVDDEPVLLRLSTRMLEAQGYTVLAADGPAEAMRLASADGNHLDLLLTDVVMPGMNGRDLAKRITKVAPGLPCVFMSGHTADVTAVGGALEDMGLFIQKPFTGPDLVRTVDEALAASQPTPAAVG